MGLDGLLAECVGSGGGEAFKPRWRGRVSSLSCTVAHLAAELEEPTVLGKLILHSDNEAVALKVPPS